MNSLIWIILFIIVIIVAKYYVTIWNFLKEKISKKTKSASVDKLKVMYGGRVVPEGSLIPLEITAGMPMMKYAGSDDQKYYTIVMVDPDSPSHADRQFSEWRHWVVGNIPGSKLRDGFIGSAATITMYDSPKPRDGSGYHRIYFKLYEQPRFLEFEQLNGNRKYWKSRAFAKQYSLNKITQTHFLVNKPKKLIS